MVTRSAAQRALHAATLLVAAFAIVGPMGALTGCAHGLGAAPTERELDNDGSTDARAYLFEKYRLEVQGGEVRRPWSSELHASGDSAEVEAYVGGSEAAEAALATLPIALSRWSGSAALPVTLLAAGASVGAGVGLFVGLLALSGPTALINDPLAGASSVALTSMYGAGAGVLAAAPITLLTWWALDAIAGHAARADMRRAVDAYNADLRARIEAGYRPELVRPPSAADPDDGALGTDDADGAADEAAATGAETAEHSAETP